MKYDITNEFIALDESQGILQNMSVNPIRLVVSVDKPDSKTDGLYIQTSEKFTFKAPDGKRIYLRTVHKNTTALVIVEDCVNFKSPASGSDGGAGIDDNVTATDKTWSSKKISNAIGTGGGGNTGYAQITKLSVVAPKQVDIVISNTDTFNLPPVEVLKFVPGLQDQVTTVCAFDNTDADDFVVGGVSGEDAKYVSFDGAMMLRTEYEIGMGDPAALEDGFMCESEEIDFAEYKSVEEVRDRWREYLNLI